MPEPRAGAAAFVGANDSCASLLAVGPGQYWMVAEVPWTERVVELPAVPESVAYARRLVREHATDVIADAAAVDLAVTEAVANVVMHAYRDLHDEERVGRIRLVVRVDGGGVEVVVGDDGVGMSPRPDSPGIGLGLALIAHLADDLEVDQGRCGTSVTMRFRRR